eukprot:6414006-Pyramimonas_sp.AAC.1
MKLARRATSRRRRLSLSSSGARSWKRRQRCSWGASTSEARWARLPWARPKGAPCIWGADDGPEQGKWAMVGFEWLP